MKPCLRRLHSRCRYPIKMIVTKTILIEVRLKIFRTDSMINATDTTFHQAPEALYRIHMGKPSRILTLAVTYGSMGIPKFLNEVITGKFISKIWNVRKSNYRLINRPLLSRRCCTISMPGSIDIFLTAIL